MIQFSTQSLAKVACLYAGAIWGIFWLPLRAISEIGINGIWSSAIWFAVPATVLLPVAIYRWQSLKTGGLELQITTVLSGMALLLYTLAFVYTDVIHAMLLYYLTPIWSTMLAAFFLGERITAQRLIAITLAVLGMLIIFGLGLKFPTPRNIGDWMGILSGILWAIAIVRIRACQNHSAIDMTIGFFFWSMLFAALACLILVPNAIPSYTQIQSTIVWLFPFMTLIVIPGAFASLWGPKFLSPGLASLLMMTEIIFGAITAAIFANEPFGPREIAGIFLIASSGLVEPVYDFIRNH